MLTERSQANFGTSTSRLFGKIAELAPLLFLNSVRRSSLSEQREFWERDRAVVSTCRFQPQLDKKILNRDAAAVSHPAFPLPVISDPRSAAGRRANTFIVKAERVLRRRWWRRVAVGASLRGIVHTSSWYRYLSKTSINGLNSIVKCVEVFEHPLHHLGVFIIQLNSPWRCFLNWSLLDATFNNWSSAMLLTWNWLSHCSNEVRSGTDNAPMDCERFRTTENYQVAVFWVVKEMLS